MILYAHERRHQKGIEKYKKEFTSNGSERWLRSMRKERNERKKRGTKLKLNKTTQAIAHEHFSFNLTFDRDG